MLTKLEQEQSPLIQNVPNNEPEEQFQQQQLHLIYGLTIHQKQTLKSKIRLNRFIKKY